LASRQEEATNTLGTYLEFWILEPDRTSPAVAGAAAQLEQRLTIRLGN